MLVVVSRERAEAREVDRVLAMVDAGVARVHLRRPGLDAAGRLADLLRFPPHCWPRLSVHGGLPEGAPASTRVVGGHLRGADRGVAGVAPGAPLSASVHSAAELAARAALPLAYVLASPVAPSLSKAGYAPTLPARDLLASLRAASRGRGVRIVALGGVTADNARDLGAIGFDGVAAIGAVWDAGDPVAAALAIAAEFAAGDGARSDALASGPPRG